MMTTELYELKVGEVSLVDKGAIKRKFVILKNEGDADMSDSFMLEVDEKLEDLVKTLNTADDSVVTLVKQMVGMNAETLQLFKCIISPDVELSEELVKSGLSDKASEAIKAALNALKSVKGELPDDIMRKIAAMGGLNMPKDDDKKKDTEDKEDEMPDKDPKKDVKKEDKQDEVVKGLDSLTDAQREAVEAVMKQHDAQRDEAIKKMEDKFAEEVTKREEMEAQLTKEKEERIQKEYVQKASAFSKLTITAEELGPILKAMNDSLDEDQFKKMEEVLKAANEALEQSEIFKTAGSDSVDDASAEGQLENIAKNIVKENGVSYIEAYELAMKQNPQLANDAIAGK